MRTTLILTVPLAALALIGCQSQQATAPTGTTEQIKDLSALEPFKALAGTWECDSDADGKADMVVTYQTVSNGSAVVERLFPGAPHEMVTTYYTNFGRVCATHYCAMQNQPTMTGTWDAARKSCHFAMTSLSNAKPDAAVMGDMQYDFIDANTFRAAWHTVKAGVVDKDHAGGTFKRKI